MSDNTLLGTFRNAQDTDNIHILDILTTEIDGEDEIYLVVRYKGKVENLLLQEYGFRGEECPYNTDKIKSVPYFVIENNVYYTSDIAELGSTSW